MQTTPPFKLNKNQLSDLDDSALKLGINKSKIARAAIQLMNEKIERANFGELKDLIVEITLAEKRSGV